MNTIIPSWIFYLISTLSSIKGFLFGASIVGLIIYGIYLTYGMILIMVGKDFGSNDDDFVKGKSVLNQSKKSAVIMLIIMLISCFIPSEKTMYTMLANSFITHNNVETFKGNAKELTDYVFDKIKEIQNDNGSEK